MAENKAIPRMVRCGDRGEVLVYVVECDDSVVVIMDFGYAVVIDRGTPLEDVVCGSEEND